MISASKDLFANPFGRKINLQLDVFQNSSEDVEAGDGFVRSNPIAKKKNPSHSKSIERNPLTLDDILHIEGISTMPLGSVEYLALDSYKGSQIRISSQNPILHFRDGISYAQTPVFSLIYPKDNTSFLSPNIPNIHQYPQMTNYPYSTTVNYTRHSVNSGDYREMIENKDTINPIFLVRHQYLRYTQIPSEPTKYLGFKDFAYLKLSSNALPKFVYINSKEEIGGYLSIKSQNVITHNIINYNPLQVTELRKKPIMYEPHIIKGDYQANTNVHHRMIPRDIPALEIQIVKYSQPQNFLSEKLSWSHISPTKNFTNFVGLRYQSNNPELYLPMLDLSLEQSQRETNYNHEVIKSEEPKSQSPMVSSSHLREFSLNNNHNIESDNRLPEYKSPDLKIEVPEYTSNNLGSHYGMEITDFLLSDRVNNPTLQDYNPSLKSTKLAVNHGNSFLLQLNELGLPSVSSEILSNTSSYTNLPKIHGLDGLVGIVQIVENNLYTQSTHLKSEYNDKPTQVEIKQVNPLTIAGKVDEELFSRYSVQLSGMNPQLILEHGFSSPKITPYIPDINFVGYNPILNNQELMGGEYPLDLAFVSPERIVQEDYLFKIDSNRIGFDYYGLRSTRAEIITAHKDEQSHKLHNLPYNNAQSSYPETEMRVRYAEQQPVEVEMQAQVRVVIVNHKSFSGRNFYGLPYRQQESPLKTFLVGDNSDVKGYENVISSVLENQLALRYSQPQNFLSENLLWSPISPTRNSPSKDFLGYSSNLVQANEGRKVSITEPQYPSMVYPAITQKTTENVVELGVSPISEVSVIPVDKRIAVKEYSMVYNEPLQDMVIMHQGYKAEEFSIPFLSQIAVTNIAVTNTPIQHPYSNKSESLDGKILPSYEKRDLNVVTETNLRSQGIEEIVSKKEYSPVNIKKEVDTGILGNEQDKWYKPTIKDSQPCASNLDDFERDEGRRLYSNGTQIDGIMNVADYIVNTGNNKRVNVKVSEVRTINSAVNDKRSINEYAHEYIGNKYVKLDTNSALYAFLQNGGVVVEESYGNTIYTAGGKNDSGLRAIWQYSSDFYRAVKEIVQEAGGELKEDISKWDMGNPKDLQKALTLEHEYKIGLIFTLNGKEPQFDKKGRSPLEKMPELSGDYKVSVYLVSKEFNLPN